MYGCSRALFFVLSCNKCLKFSTVIRGVPRSTAEVHKEKAGTIEKRLLFIVIYKRDSLILFSLKMFGVHLGTLLPSACGW